MVSLMAVADTSGHMLFVVLAALEIYFHGHYNVIGQPNTILVYTIIFARGDRNLWVHCLCAVFVTYFCCWHCLVYICMYVFALWVLLSSTGRESPPWPQLMSFWHQACQCIHQYWRYDVQAWRLWAGCGFGWPRISPVGTGRRPKVHGSWVDEGRVWKACWHL